MVDNFVSSPRQARPIEVPQGGGGGGGSLARGIQAATSVITAASNWYYDREMASDAVTMTEIGDAATRDISSDLEQIDYADPDYAMRVDEVIDRHRASLTGTDEYGSLLSENKEKLDKYIEDVRKKSQVLAGKSRDEYLQTKAVGDAETLQNRALNSIRNDPDNAGLYLQEVQTGMATLSDAIHPDVRREMADKFADQTIIQQALGIADRDGQEAGLAFLEEAGADMSPTVLRDTENQIRSVAAQNRADQDVAFSERRYDLQVAAHSGRLSLADLQRAEDEGLFATPSGQAMLASMRMTVIGNYRRRASGTDTTSVAMAKYNSGGVDTQKEADAVYELALGRIGDNPTAADLIRVGVQVSDNAGFVPSAVRNMVERGERSNDPDTLAAAAHLHRELTANTPFRTTGAGDRVMLAAELIEAGETPQSAALAVIDRMPDPTLKTAREAAYKEQAKGVDYAYELADRAGFSSTFNTRDEELPASMVAQYERDVRTYYTLYGDMDVAMNVAARKAKERGVGRTEVAGVPRYTQYPIEAVITGYVPGLSQSEVSTWVSIQADEALTSVGVVPHGGFTAVDGIPPYALEADAQTERDVRAGRPPSYRVLVRGPYQDLAPHRLNDGGYLRITAPSRSEFMASDFVRSRVAEAKAEVERIERDRNIQDRRGIRGAGAEINRKTRDEEPSGLARVLDALSDAVTGPDQSGNR